MIFWHFFFATVGVVMGVAVAILAVIGLFVLALIGKQAYDAREETIRWPNEPPSEPQRFNF